MMYRNKGFTLIELMIAVAVVGILSAVALPYYGDYVIRSKAPQGQTALSTFLAHMEQRYQDTGNYGANNKCVLTPADTQNFTMDCTLGANGQSFTATATGKGQMAGITYEIDSSDTRKTKAHPKGLPSTNCWTTKGVVCD